MIGDIWSRIDGGLLIIFNDKEHFGPVGDYSFNSWVNKKFTTFTGGTSYGEYKRKLIVSGEMLCPLT